MNEYRRKPKVIIKRKSGFLGKIFCLFLGFILGVVSVVGGVAGAGYYFANRKVSEIDEMVGDKLPVELSQLLSDEYYENTVLNLLGGVATASAEIAEGTGSFHSLYQISPSVKDTVDSLAAQIKGLGSNLSQEEIASSLMNTPFGEMSAYLKGDLVNSFVLGDLLIATGMFTFEQLTQDAPMMVLCYGVEGEDYQLDEVNKKVIMLGESKATTFGDVRKDGLTVNIMEVPLDAFLSAETTDKKTLYFLYGRENTHYEFVYVDKGAPAPEGTSKLGGDPSQPNKDVYARLLKKQVAAHAIVKDGVTKYYAHNEYGEPLLSDVNDKTSYVTLEASNKSEYDYQYVHHDKTYYLKADETLSPIRIKGALAGGSLETYAPAYYVVEKTTTSESNEMQYLDVYYQRNCIADLEDKEKGIVFNMSSRLELYEVLDEKEIKSNPFLKYMGHVTLDELPLAIESLSIAEAFETDIYKMNESKTHFLDVNGNVLYEKDGAYYTNEACTVAGERVVTGTWSYLLDDPSNPNDKPEDYTVTQVNVLVENMKSSIQSTNLGQLVKDEIVTFTDDSASGGKTAEAKKTEFLTKTINGEKVSEMSITQLLEIILAMPST